jgi:hypothetical protein
MFRIYDFVKDCWVAINIKSLKKAQEAKAAYIVQEAARMGSIPYGDLEVAIFQEKK